MTLRDLVQALNQKAGFELVDHSISTSQLRFLGRVPLDPVGLNMANWLIVIRQLLLQSGKAAWNIDISKSYFLMGDKVVYAWRLIVQADSVEAHLDEIGKVITSAPHSNRAEVSEMPLAGVNANRNSTSGGHRGAGLVDRVPVGPLAVQAKQMGV